MYMFSFGILYFDIFSVDDSKRPSKGWMRERIEGFCGLWGGGEFFSSFFFFFFATLGVPFLSQNVDLMFGTKTLESFDMGLFDGRRERGMGTLGVIRAKVCFKCQFQFPINEGALYEGCTLHRFPAMKIIYTDGNCWMNIPDN